MARRIGATYRRKGTHVCIKPTPEYRRKKGQGIIHLSKKCGVLMEDARIGPEAGWDVYDVRLDDGEETAAYGFDMTPRTRADMRKK
jgi:hypothetical protein